jgi:E1-E2 ATPase
MIEAAVILSAVARHWPDFGIILLLLLANAVVGFWEEHQVGNAIAAVKATLAIKAGVKRDGKWVTPAAHELVPGDVIRVRMGDIVPADARLLEGDPLRSIERHDHFEALLGHSVFIRCAAPVWGHVKHNQIRVRNSLFLVPRYVEARVAEMLLHWAVLSMFLRGEKLLNTKRRGVGVSSIQMRPRNQKWTLWDHKVLDRHLA